MNRQEYWLSKGYTMENIENHLRFERKKAKESRDRKKKNNEKNQELIKQIKKDLVGKSFNNHTIISISPSVDGLGFWYKTHKVFKDKSEGDFRYFNWFSDYSLKKFKDNLLFL
jgi:hypothetical protein